MHQSVNTPGIPYRQLDPSAVRAVDLPDKGCFNMASIKELQVLFQVHQQAEAANVAKAAEAAKARLAQQALDVSDLIIQAVAFTPFVKFPEDIFKALFKASLEVFESQEIKVNKDRLNNNVRDLTTWLEAIDPRMDESIQKMAIAKLTEPAPAKPKEVGVPRYPERKKQDKKKAPRQAWDENTVGAAMAKAKAKAEAEAKDNPNGLPEGAVDLTAAVEK